MNYINKDTDFSLPRNGNGTRVEFNIKAIISRVEADSFDRGKLLYIQDVLGVDSTRIRNERRLAHASFQPAPVRRTEEFML